MALTPWWITVTFILTSLMICQNMIPTNMHVLCWRKVIKKQMEVLCFLIAEFICAVITDEKFVINLVPFEIIFLMSN